MNTERLRVVVHGDLAGRVLVYLPERETWRPYWPVDAQTILDNGDGTLDGPADAPIESTPRVDAHVENLARAQRRRGRV